MMLTVPRRRSARTSVAVIATFVLSIGAFAVMRAASPADATSDGSPYTVPQAVDENPDPNILETTIVADETDGVDIGNGELANVLTFNGHIPGPELRLQTGDTLIVHYENALEHPSGIHWHGIENPNKVDGTPLTQNMIEPGEEYIYKFIVPRAGVYWYHPHHHSSTNQVFKGLYGSLIVTDPAETTLQAEGVLPPAANTHTMVLGDVTVCHDGADPAATYDPSLPHASGGPLPAQSGPHPDVLCDQPVDEDGFKIEDDDNGVDGDGTPVPLAEDEVPNIQLKIGSSSPSHEGNIVLTNGENVGGRAGSPSSPGALSGTAETLSVAPGSGQRFQVVNTAQVRFFRLRLTESDGTQIKLYRVGGEGGLLGSAVLDGGTPGGYDWMYAEGEVLIGPGDRIDVVAAFPDDATGVATLWTLDFKRVGTGSPQSPWAGLPTVPVAHFDLSGPAVAPYSIASGTPLLTDASVGSDVEALGAPTGGLITPAGGFVAPKEGMADPDIKLQAGGGATKINGVQGLHDFPGDYTAAPKVGSTRYAAEIGDILELTVTNETPAQHPFHPHGFSIQPLTLEKPPGTVVYTFPKEFADTVNVPGNTTLRYRVRLDERPLVDGVTPGGATGRWVFHCHIFFHAVFGMISEIIVTDGSGNERPYVDTDEVETAAVNKGGDVATMSGTLSDIDGDAVTLEASKGTVTDNGDGTWDWSYTTDNSPAQGGFVYITATDSQGNKDQALFDMEVINAPPVLAPIPDQASEEGDVVSVSTTFTDADAGDTHTGTIDWGDGTGPQPATIVEGNPGTLSGGHVYGDDGTFTATATVTDGDDSDSESFDVVVDNIDPDANIDETGTILVNGVPTFFTDAGTALDLSARITDPGSDDLMTSWDWGDGPPSPDETQTSFANGLSPDPDPSPDVNPRDITHDTIHAFADACTYTVTFAADDDDGGTDSDTVKVVVTGPPGKSRSAGYWQHQYKGNGKIDYTPAQLNCFLQIVGFLSKVFNETRDASTRTKAHDVIWLAGNGGDERQKLDRDLIVVWLNLAGGSFEYNGLHDTNGDHVPDTTFAAIVAQAESVRNNPAATKNQLKDQQQRLQKLKGSSD